MKHANVALFIPFNGCPHRCSFCDQRSITGMVRQPSPDEVRRTIEAAVCSLKENTYRAEIAFFGGSFTAIERGYMCALLEAAAPYLDRFKGIRISTRPDAIDPQVLALLEGYGVTSIELGAQSMSDDVLRLNGRGHTAEDVRTAAQLIRAHSFELGLQMMTGLYGSNDADDRCTAEALIRLHPDTVRIYPTLVMRGTRLGELYAAGIYHPQELDSAVELCAGLMELFDANGVRVIRVGLHDAPTLHSELLAGPCHPAFRELCESRILLRRLTGLFDGQPTGEYRVAVHPRSRSKLVGNQKSNLIALRGMGYTLNIVEDDSLKPMEVVLL